MTMYPASESIGQQVNDAIQKNPRIILYALDSKDLVQLMCDTITAGEFDAYLLAWSGRPDPDGNVYSFLACKQPLNDSGYCKPEVDALLNEALTKQTLPDRMKAYEQVNRYAQDDNPILYLYHRNWLWAYNAKLTGVREVPDGLLRVQGLKMN